MQSKNDRQDSGIEKWRLAGGRGTLEWATAMGKTYAAYKVVKRMREKRLVRAIAVVPQIEIQYQWIEFFAEMKTDIEVYVINTAIEMIDDLDCTLLILDEKHRYAAPEFSKIYNVNAKYILALTATEERPDGEHLKYSKYAPVVDTITIEEAVENGWIAESLEYNYAVDMSKEEKIIYGKISENYEKYFKMFGRNFQLAQLCGLSTDAGKAARIDFALRRGWSTSAGDTHMYSPKNLQFYSFKYMKAMRDRRTFLYNAMSKVEAVVEIHKSFPHLKTISFSESTEFADHVHSRIPSVVYHTELKTILEDGKKIGKDRLKKRAIEAIRSGTSRFISTAKALDLGFNVDDMELGILCSYTSNHAQYDQRGGKQFCPIHQFNSGKP